MKLLWDTHTYLWFSKAINEISEKVKEVLLDDKTENYLSIISIWEITIKSGLGKLTIHGTLDDIWNDIISSGITVIPLSIEHLKLYENLYFHHRDPFDLYFEKTNISRIW